jgi:hypothetical protein
VVTLVFLILLKWRYLLYTFTLVITDCISINTNLSYLEMYYYSEHSSRRFLLPNSMFHGYRQKLYRLTSVGLLWFPSVGFNQYSNLLIRVKLCTPSTIWLLSSWTLLKIFHVATTLQPYTYHCFGRLKLTIDLSYTHITLLGDIPYILAGWVYLLSYTYNP